MISTEQTPHLKGILASGSGIAAEYRHVPKHVVFGETLEQAGVVLKWYEVHPLERPVPVGISQLARSYLTKNDLEARGLGFVILHRCGEDFYFLIVSSWRNNNELWETVFYKNGEAMSDFAPFARDAVHKPTFCVWELVPLWHEKQVWERFLKSPRDAAAAQSWLRDCYSGPA